MVINFHFDVSYLTALHAQSLAAWQYFLGPNPVNEYLTCLNTTSYMLCTILKLVLASTVEAERPLPICTRSQCYAIHPSQIESSPTNHLNSYRQYHGGWHCQQHHQMTIITSDRNALFLDCNNKTPKHFKFGNDPIQENLTDHFNTHDVGGNRHAHTYYLQAKYIAACTA